MNSWWIPVLSVLYVGALFLLAYWGDNRDLGRRFPRLPALLYGLTLAVYCTSWTFYGAVGAAIHGGWSFLPIYLGPILLLMFGRGLLERVILASKMHNITSIADFIASRYGKVQHLAILVTVVAVVGVLPYIALQLKAVTLSIEALSGAGGGERPLLGDTALLVALLLAVFAILFGTRRLDATEHHRGLMLAIAAESLVKLLALLAVAGYALYLLLGNGSQTELWHDARVSALLSPDALPPGFFAQTLLAFVALLCLPRQFQVTVVECDDVRHLRTARWSFGVYLVLVCLAVLPIALAALLNSAAIAGTPDMAVLRLPLLGDAQALALFVYIGGFSAATGMVIVETVALSTMICNDLVMPLLWKFKRFGLPERQNVADLLLTVRRISILVIALLGYAYYRLTEQFQALAAIGLLAFSAVAQFAPAIIGGLYWRGASRRGVAVGLLAGFSLWLYTLLLPTLANAGWFDLLWLQHGPFGIDWLRPQSLFNLSGWDPVTHGVFWSLLANISLFVFFSLRHRPDLNQRIQAAPFLNPYASPVAPPDSEDWGRVKVGELLALSSRIVGDEVALRAFAEFADEREQALAAEQLADRSWFRFTERLLAGAVGAASARAMLTTALRGSGMDIGQVVALLDQTSQEQRFNRELLHTMMENISLGISVVDSDMRLVAWNRQYLELFDYPDGMVYIGCPIANLIRYNAERGECGPGEVDEHVRKRLGHLRAGTPHVFERVRADGRVIEMRGQPIHGGGYVTTYADITSYKRNELALRQSEQSLREYSETLEQRVRERTEALQAALEAQEQARQEAVWANQSKTRFIAAASHDLLQPMNAARLFTTALNQHESPDAEIRTLARQIDGSLRGAEDLLSALLDISRLDSGALTPNRSSFSLAELFSDLKLQFAPLAETRGLQFRTAPTRLWVNSDRQMLRRILQNFVSNALRYTRSGGVVLGARHSAAGIRLEVWDSGPGIPLHHQAAIFDEFHRTGEVSPWGEKGLGLGLAICRRMARLLEHDIAVRSEPGRGSVFSVTVPRAAASKRSNDDREALAPTGSLDGLRVLCIDNEPDILLGMQALLSRWGCVPLLAADQEAAEHAMALPPSQRPQLILADFHLADGVDGLALLSLLANQTEPGLPGALITADHSEMLAARVKAAGFTLLRKPVKPAALRAFLTARQH
ncbi:MAG: NahK/ErcS family hybrid sensor histidine kinase/response regulator [Pseudomonadota bacterium]